MFTQATPPSKIEDWKLLFASLLKTQPDQLNFSLEFNNGSIIISTPEAKLAEDLASILKSPEAVLANIDYTLNEIKTGAAPTEPEPIPAPQYPIQIELTHNMGQTFFNSLFNEQLRKQVGISWTSENENQDNYVLEASCNTDFIELTKAQIAIFRKILANSSYDQLRQAIAHDQAQQKSLEKNENVSGPLAAFVEKILYLSSDNKTIYFDYGLLVNSLTPPKVQELVPVGASTSSDTQFVYHIDAKHLMNYFSIIFQEGFILHVNGDKAKPICFDMGRAIPQRQSVSIVMDCSGSLAPNAEDLKGNVINFIKKMKDNPQFNDTEIKITPFASTTEPTVTFDLTDLTTIDKYIKNIKIQGKTALHTTIDSVLSKLKDDVLSMNTTVVIFTDGLNTDSMSLEELQSKTSKSIQQTNNPPKIFTLGLGDEYNADMLDKLATSTGCKHINLKDLVGFKEICDHLDTMSIPRRLVRIIQESTQLAFTIPAQESRLTVSAIELAFPGTFTVDGKQYHAAKGGLKLQTESNVAPPLPTAAPEVVEGVTFTNISNEATVSDTTIAITSDDVVISPSTSADIPINAASLISQFGLVRGVPVAEPAPINQVGSDVQRALTEGSWCTIQ